MANSISIQEAVDNFKALIEGSILVGGEVAKQAMIRSSKPILNIHEAVKSELIKAGVPEGFIFPPLDSRTPELKLAGSRKQKNQDICVVPDHDKSKEILAEGLLQDVVDEFGEKFTERTISINVRSQISSIQKNFDTLYERTTSEAINLHDRCPKMCMGEVYMIAVPEYDDRAIRESRIVFKKASQSLVSKYIKSFQAINNRKGIEKNFYKYEKVCLLIVDFSKSPAKIYDTNAELIEDGLLPEDSRVDISKLSWSKFIPELLETYIERFHK
jgi:hypothetical protein